jgi:hypothetical protein
MMASRASVRGTSLALVLLLRAAVALGGGRFAVDPDAGSNTVSAVFEAAIGERITAVSSQVACTLRVDERRLTGDATCSVPLTAIRVDNDETKSEHFRQWATNRQLDPERCTFDLEVPGLALQPPVEPMRAVPFATEGAFRICGRPRDDGGRERIRGTIVYLPAGSYKDVRTLRIRGRIEGFDRERYQIGPRWTAGWLARVQELAPVVATGGTIEVNLFATESVER